MNYRALTVFFLLFFFSLPNAFGQSKAEWKKLEEERKKAEELQRTNKVILGNIASFRDTREDLSEIFNLDFFLPDMRDSWTVSISEKGGFQRKNRLLAAINSNKNYLCHPRTFDISKNVITNDVFDEINKLVNRQKFILNSLAIYDETNPTENCADCSTEILTITRKTKKNVIKDIYYVKSLADSAPNLQEIYEKVLNSAACQ